MANGKILAATALTGLWLCMIFCGIGCCVPGVIWIIKFTNVAGSNFHENADVGVVGIGLWGGIPLIIAGALGVILSILWPWKEHIHIKIIVSLCVSGVACIICVAQACVGGDIYTKLTALFRTACPKSYTTCDSGVRSVFHQAMNIFLAISALSAFGAMFSLMACVVRCMLAGETRKELTKLPRAFVISVDKSSGVSGGIHNPNYNPFGDEHHHTSRNESRLGHLV